MARRTKSYSFLKPATLEPAGYAEIFSSRSLVMLARATKLTKQEVSTGKRRDYSHAEYAGYAGYAEKNLDLL